MIVFNTMKSSVFIASMPPDMLPMQVPSSAFKMVGHGSLMSLNKFVWQSIHVSVRMTYAAFATDLVRYMSADATTSHRESVIAMGTP